MTGVLRTADQPLHSEFRVSDAPEYDLRSPTRWISSHVLRYPGLLLLFVFSTLMLVVFSAFLPRLTGSAFDAITQPDPQAALFRIALLLLGAALLRGLFDLLNIVGIEFLAQRLERDARAELAHSLLGKSQAFHDRQRVGDVMARAANDVRQLNLMFSPGVQLILDSALSVIVPLVFIALIEPQLLLFPVLFVIGFVLSLKRYTERLDPVSTAMRESFGRLNAGLNETVTGIELVKAAAAENREKRKFYRNAREFRDWFVRQGEVQARYLPYLLIGLTIAATFAHGLWLLTRGVVSVGDVVAVVGLVGVLRGPADLSIFTFALVQLGMAGARRILELIRSDSELDENPAGHAGPITGSITFDDVLFTYPGAQSPTLTQLDFSIAPGETIALVGQTGTGKSTLTKLVNRTYDVTSGRILIDGIDVRDWSLASLRSQISVIEQEVFLFSRSIADNIAFGLPGSTRQQVEAVARAAQAHGFISALPDGYDTVIGERGMTLSGGQRQRLAIARALLTDPRILILDDATSAVDSATEDEIQTAINTVLSGRTSLVITHRLSQIRRADRILLLDGNRVADFGTHPELLERSPIYQRIFQRFD